jgi:hypothetical protein
MMFRLGEGGLNPDPLSRYEFRSLPTADYARNEPGTTMSSALDPNAFQGGDKNIQTLKEWMDVVMTKILELSGTTYWYEDTSTLSLVNMFKDLLATSIKSKGVWQSSDTTAGLLTWTEDIVVQSVVDKKDVIIRAGSETLANDQVLYLEQNRGDTFNTGGISVDWTNGANYIDGTLGSFENLTKGDWVKKANDEDYEYLRVEEFYADTGLAGGVTAASNALSIKLSGSYGGSTESSQGVYVQGEYLSTDVTIGDRNDPALTTAGGNLYWLAMRSDTVMSISDITTTDLTIDIENHDGNQAKCTLVGHGLTDKQRIGISGSTNFNGSYQVNVQDADIFYINLTGGPFADELGVSAHYATVTTTTTSTADGYQLESSTHGFETDQLVSITDTTNYNGDFNVFVTGSDTFTVAVLSSIATESAGTATSVNMYVRTDLGPTKLSQGENKQIGEVESENIMSFIGMDNASQTTPVYDSNIRGSLTDSLTDRLSTLTDAMGDQQEDRSAYLKSEEQVFWEGTYIEFLQDIELEVLNTKTGTTTVHTIPLAESPISLVDGESVWVEIDRLDASETLTVNKTSVTAIPPQVQADKDVFVLFRRIDNATLATKELYVPFNNQIFTEGQSARLGAGGPGGGVTKVTFHDTQSSTLPSGATITIDGVAGANGDTVLFTNLSVDNNRIFELGGVGSSITWKPLREFGGQLDPGDGDMVIITDGDSFQESIGKFNGTDWVFNDRVRYFNGADYWEMSSIKTTDIDNNTSGDIFTVSLAGSENFIVSYSILRGSTKETGQVFITSDGTDTSHAVYNTFINNTGVELSSDIVSGNLRFRYTSDNSGTGTMKYFVQRWSNGPGGPGGIPNYSTSGSPAGAAAGTIGDVQFHGTAGILDGDTRFKWDTATGSLNLNGLEVSSLSGAVPLNDAQALPDDIIQYNAAANKFMIMEYSVERGIDTRVGRLLVTSNGVIVDAADDFTETLPTGVTLSADVFGGNVRIRYITTATGNAATFKYSFRRWN